METQNLHHIVLIVADPDIWKKDMCKPLEEQHYRWRNHKYSRDICTWVYIDITTKEMCMGLLGVVAGLAARKPFIEHAISFEDFYEIVKEYKRTFRVSKATRLRMLEKYKDFEYMVTSKEEQDHILAVRAERQRQLQLPKTIISFEECKEQVWKAIPEEDREYIFKEYADYIEEEYNDWIERLKNNQATQKEFEEHMFSTIVGRMLYWY